MCKEEQEEQDEQKESEFLEKVKKYLPITWNEEDENINNLIEEAKQYLSKKAGTEIDFNKDLVALGLLKDYCRYTRNFSGEYFEQNFIEKVLDMQIKYAIENGDLNEEKTEN